MPWPQQRYAPDRLAPLATGAGVTVAVIDSGVDNTHAQMKGRVLSGTDYLDAGGDGTLDCAGHGTAVASIIAATARNGMRFHGLAPDANILPVRISEQQIVNGKESGRTVSANQFAQAIGWAVGHGAKVLNLSVVLYEDDPAVRDAIAYAIAKDVVVVAAVGNLHDNGDPRPFPAAYDGVLGVGSIGPDGYRSPFSQVGMYVDLVAPGGGARPGAQEAGRHQLRGALRLGHGSPDPAVPADSARGSGGQPDHRDHRSSAEWWAVRLGGVADPDPGRHGGCG
jgi:subtilisin family serine protease